MACMNIDPQIALSTHKEACFPIHTLLQQDFGVSLQSLWQTNLHEIGSWRHYCFAWCSCLIITSMCTECLSFRGFTVLAKRERESARNPEPFCGLLGSKQVRETTDDLRLLTQFAIYFSLATTIAHQQFMESESLASPGAMQSSRVWGFSVFAKRKRAKPWTLSWALCKETRATAHLLLLVGSAIHLTLLLLQLYTNSSELVSLASPGTMMQSVCVQEEA